MPYEARMKARGVKLTAEPFGLPDSYKPLMSMIYRLALQIYEYPTVSEVSKDMILSNISNAGLVRVIAGIILSNSQSLGESDEVRSVLGPLSKRRNHTEAFAIIIMNLYIAKWAMVFDTTKSEPVFSHGPDLASTDLTSISRASAALYLWACRDGVEFLKNNVGVLKEISSL